MNARNLGLAVAILMCGVLGWMTLNLSIENDGLKQVATSQRQSIQTMLEFAKATVRCDVKPSEVAASLRATELPPKNGVVEVATLAFKAQFREGRLNRLEIVNVGDAPLCGA